MATQNNYMWNKKIPCLKGTYSLILTNAIRKKNSKKMVCNCMWGDQINECCTDLGGQSRVKEADFSMAKDERAKRLIGRSRSHALLHPTLGIKGNADTVILH